MPGTHHSVVDGPDIQLYRDLVGRTAGSEAPLFSRMSDVASGEARAKTAIIDGDSSLTYAELLTLSGGFGNSLRESGLRPGETVGVLMRNGMDFVIAAFGCWMTGAALVPLNPQLQAAEMVSYVRDTGMRVVISNTKDSELLRSPDVAALLEQHWLFNADGTWTYAESPGIKCDAATGLHSAQWPSTIAYSTGSTGRPKRVTRTQAQFAAEQVALSRILGIKPSDRILGVAPFFHGYSLMYSVLLPLLAGATVVMVGTFLPARVAAIIERERISAMSAVPFMYDLLAKSTARHDFSTLRFALSGGAPLAIETARSFQSRTGVCLRQAYGSTETGAISIVSEDSARLWEPGEVGRPIPGVSVQVVNEAGEAVPAGEEGDVLIQSPFAAQGYDGEVGSQESRFTDVGFLPGDRGRLSAQGNLMLSGRHRRFINAGGSKVDPAEVESVLLEITGVADVAVFGVPDGAAGEALHVALVASRALSSKEVREHCAHRLAAFKCPRSIEFRTELPRSPLGKVLRQQLIDEAIAAGSAVATDQRNAAS